MQYTDSDHFCTIYVTGCAKFKITLRADEIGENKVVEMGLVTLKLFGSMVCSVTIFKQDLKLLQNYRVQGNETSSAA